MSRPTLLIPLDGSGLAEASLHYLGGAKDLGPFDVELVHVVDPEEEGPKERYARVWDTYLSQTAARVRQAVAMDVRAVNREGNPSAVILEEAEDPRVAMIVISTHGLSGFNRWRIGSVADKVIRGAACPVMAVGPATQGAPPAFTRILVPLDGSRLAEEALPFAKLLAERLKTGVRLVRAVYPRTVLDELAGSLTADVVESYELMAGEYLDEARLELETSRPVDTQFVSGPAVDVILSQVKEAPCDLVVMTSHGRHGFVRFAMGSVTGAIVAASPVPVLVVKPGQWDRFRSLMAVPAAAG